MSRRVAVIGVLALAAGCQGSDPLPLSQTDQELVSVTGYNFGTVTVGQTSSPHTVTVAPAAGNNDDIIDAVTANCPDFTITADNLPAEVIRTLDCSCQTCFTTTCVTDIYQTYQFATAFHPSIGGAQSCVVTLHINGDTGNRTITLSGTGQVPPIDIDVQPASVAFGDVRVGSASSYAPVDIRNFGGSTMTVSAVTPSTGYDLTGSVGTVDPGGSLPFQVRCLPTAAGDLPGTLTIDSDDPSTPTVSIPLSCNGVTSNLAVDPSPATIPTTRVGIATGLTITLLNLGGAATTVNTVTIDGVGLSLQTDPSGTDIPAMSSISVTVGFDAATRGDASGTLTIDTSDGPRTAQVTARAVQPSLSLAPDGVVDFGPVCAGQSATQTFTILDVGDGDFALTGVSTPDAPFTSSFAGGGTILASGANQATFDITAMPTDPVVSTSSVTVTTDIESDPEHTIDISVTGLPPGATATPAMLDLGSNPLDTTTLGQVITLTNCNPSSIEFSNARIEGDDADSFTIVQAPMSSSIAANGAAKWLVVFDAHTIGSKTAQFLVDNPAGTSIVTLLGEGLDPSVDGGNSVSYYTCSAGGTSAAWPIALAFLGFRRRRRA